MPLVVLTMFHSVFHKADSTGQFWMALLLPLIKLAFKYGSKLQIEKAHNQDALHAAAFFVEVPPHSPCARCRSPLLGHDAQVRHMQAGCHLGVPGAAVPQHQGVVDICYVAAD